MSVRPPVRPSVRPSARPSVRLSVGPSVKPFQARGASAHLLRAALVDVHMCLCLSRLINIVEDAKLQIYSRFGSGHLNNLMTH